eukprot:CCRYP_005421-RA/>CCRYP_005421-RA protein AED:0.65 eAED:0.42 QI:0/-1/0/1/-1/1/1/0/190
MSPRTIKEGINNGSIPSAVSDTAPPPQQAPYMTHSSTLRPAPPKYLCYRQEPPPQPQSKHSSSSMSSAANTVDIVPNLHQTLLSGSKFAGADYTAVMRQTQVNFYDSATINITRARSPHWLSMPHRPLANSTPSVTVNDNTDTLILDSKCGLQSTHPDIMYLHLHTSENTSKPPYNATQTIYSMCMNSPA